MRVLSERKGVAYCGPRACVSSTESCICFVNLHIAGNSGVSIGVPSASNARLAFEYPKLVEAKDLLQAASHCNTRLTCANHKDRVICVDLLIISADVPNC